MEDKSPMSFSNTKEPVSFAKMLKMTRQPSSNTVSFGVTKAGEGLRCQCQIGEFYVIDLGWILGDRVDMLFFPEDKLVIVKRVEKNQPGFNLNQSGKTIGRLKFSFVWKDTMPYHNGATDMEGIEVRKDPKTQHQSLYFNIPSSFNFPNGG